MMTNRFSEMLHGKPAHYWRKDMFHLFIAALCVDIALENSNKAIYLYRNIVDAWNKPGCKTILQNKIMLPVLELMNLEENVTIFDHKNHCYSSTIKDFIKASSENSDSVYLLNLITDFIKIVFNCEASEISIERAIHLYLAITIYSLGDFLDNNFIFNILNKEHVNQTHLKLLKRYGYNFRQEDIIWYVAWYWYQCRVVNSSIEEFINKYFHEEGIQLEPSKIKIEIFSGDIAMGYIFRHQN